MFENAPRMLGDCLGIVFELDQKLTLEYEIEVGIVQLRVKSLSVDFFLSVEDKIRPGQESTLQSGAWFTDLLFV